MSDDAERKTHLYRTFGLWFIAGAATGAAAGLLLAPTSGEKLRSNTASSFNSLSDAARGYLESAVACAELLAVVCRYQASGVSAAVTAGVEEARRIKQELTEL